MSNKNIKAYFKIKNNDLFYCPPAEPTSKLLHSLKIKGNWRVDKKCNLIFDVDESYSDVFGQTISFAAKIEHAAKDYLEISVLERTTPKLRKVDSVKFKGRWKVDVCNNFIFEVQRASGYDELVFGNNWETTEKNQIVFFYKRKFLKKEIINSFILEGQWRLDKNTLIFDIENDLSAGLKFRMALNNKQLMFKKERIDFTVGVEKSSVKSISLFGKWKQVNDTFEFIANFGQKNITWIFRLKKTLSRDKKITFELVNKKGDPIGVEFTFLKKIFQDANFFVKAGIGREKRIEAGFYMPF